MSQKKELTLFRGFYVNMSEPVTLVSKEGPAKKRAVVTMETADGQVGFFEVRDAIINRINKLGLLQGDEITIGFVFIGVKKNDKIYNNLFINQIDYVNSRG